MSTLPIIQSLCAKHQYLRSLQSIREVEYFSNRRNLRRDELIWALKQQIWKLKQQYKELRGLVPARAMLYEYNGRFFLASREITMTEYGEAKRLQALKVA